MSGRTREKRFIITSSRMTEAVDYRGWGFARLFMHGTRRSSGERRPPFPLNSRPDSSLVRRAQGGVADSGNGQVDRQRFSTF